MTDGANALRVAAKEMLDAFTEYSPHARPNDERAGRRRLMIACAGLRGALATGEGASR